MGLAVVRAIATVVAMAVALVVFSLFALGMVVGEPLCAAIDLFRREE